MGRGNPPFLFQERFTYVPVRFQKTISVNLFISYFPFYPLIFLDINFLKKKNSQVIKDKNRPSLTFDLKTVNQ